MKILTNNARTRVETYTYMPFSQCLSLRKIYKVLWIWFLPSFIHLLFNIKWHISHLFGACQHFSGKTGPTDTCMYYTNKILTHFYICSLNNYLLIDKRINLRNICLYLLLRSINPISDGHTYTHHTYIAILEIPI